MQTIPGIKKLSAIMIFAELGGNINLFSTAQNLTGWCGLRPKNDESAGKIKSRSITKGNKYLRRILVQTAWAASRTKNCYLKTKFEQLSIRKSSKKALIAIARRQLVIIWNVLSKNEQILRTSNCFIIQSKLKENKNIIKINLIDYLKILKRPAKFVVAMLRQLLDNPVHKVASSFLTNKNLSAF